jgi:hypothetical protein
VATPPSRSATVAVVEPFPVRPRQVPQPDIEGLVAALLDLSSSYETALRTVISMQRNLERVRRCREVSPEAALLLQEITRQLEGLRESGANVDDRLGAAALHLDTIRSACD